MGVKRLGKERESLDSLFATMLWLMLTRGIIGCKVQVILFTVRHHTAKVTVLANIKYCKGTSQCYTKITPRFEQLLRKHNVIFVELCRLVIDLMKSNDIMPLQPKLHNPLTGTCLGCGPPTADNP
jgi:hypothetical protein